MFSRHVLKVIVGFTGMIVLGLITLVVIDSFKLQAESDIPAANVGLGE